MIQYVNILTKNGKSLLFREYGTIDIDRDLLTDFLSSFLEFKEKNSQSEIRLTQTEKFKYFYSVINNIIIVVCSDLDDDDSHIKSQILSIRTKFIEKYEQSLYDEIWGENRAPFDDFKNVIDDIILDGINVSLIGYGSTALLLLICGNDIESEYIPTLRSDVDIPLYNGITRSINLWVIGTESFRSVYERVLEKSDILIIVTNSTLADINRIRYIEMFSIPKNKTVIGIANCQDMPNKLTPAFCEKIVSDRGIKFYGIDASNPVYREKIHAILSNAILKLSNGKENTTCEQCGNTVGIDFLEILQKNRTKVRDLSYCPTCNFPLRYIHYEDCIEIRTYNPIDRRHRKDTELSKRFKARWIDYLGIILNGKEQIYSNVDLNYLEGENRVDYIVERFLEGNLDQKILELYAPYIEKCNFPNSWEHPLSLPKCFSLEKDGLTYVVIGILSNPSSFLREIAFIFKKLFSIYNINQEKMDKSDKMNVRSFIKCNFEYIENGNFNLIKESLSDFLEKRNQFRNLKAKIIKGKKGKYKERWDDITCPMCGAHGKKNIKKFEDKSKILYYISIVPIYAKKHICKLCGYEI